MAKTNRKRNAGTAGIPFILIRKEAKGRVVGFNGSAKPLGERTEKDLIDLGIMAHESGNRELLKAFEVLPGLMALRTRKMALLEK